MKPCQFMLVLSLFSGVFTTLTSTNGSRGLPLVLIEQDPCDGLFNEPTVCGADEEQTEVVSGHGLPAVPHAPWHHCAGESRRAHADARTDSLQGACWIISCFWSLSYFYSATGYCRKSPVHFFYFYFLLYLAKEKRHSHTRRRSLCLQTFPVGTGEKGQKQAVGHRPSLLLFAQQSRGFRLTQVPTHVSMLFVSRISIMHTVAFSAHEHCSLSQSWQNGLPCSDRSVANVEHLFLYFGAAYKQHERWNDKLRCGQYFTKAVYLFTTFYLFGRKCQYKNPGSIKERKWFWWQGW